MIELSAPPSTADASVGAQEAASPAAGRTHRVRAADALATAVLQAAVPLMVWQETRSVAWSGFAFAAEWAPRLTSIGVAGPLVDRVSARTVMACVGVTRAVLVVLVVAGLLHGGGGPLLLLFGAAAGILAETGFVAAEVLTADAARTSRTPHRLQAFAATIDQSALLLGPLLAGVLLAAGSTVPLLVVGVISAVGAATALQLTEPPRSRDAAPAPDSGLRTGVRTLWRRPALCWVVLAATALNGLMAVVQAVTPALLISAFDRSSTTAATVWTVSAAVSLPVVALAGRAVSRFGLWTVGAGAAGTASVAGLAAAAAPSYAFYAVAVAVLAVGEGAAIVFVRTGRLALIPQAAFGATCGVTILLTLLPYPVAGLLVAMVPVASLPCLVAGAATACAVLTALSFTALHGHHFSTSTIPSSAPSRSETSMPHTGHQERRNAPGRLPGGSSAVPVQTDGILPAVGHFTLHDLPVLNSLILRGHRELPQLIKQMNILLARLPEPGSLPSADAQRLIVELGIWGSSVQRHHLDRRNAAAADAYAGLDRLRAGPAGQPLRAYFRVLAERSGTGHPPRDAYASLVLWNTPATQAVWRGARIAALPSLYRDGRVRTYTGNPGETLILELFKAIQTLETAANSALEPLWASVKVGADETLHRFEVATHMIAAAQRILRDFPAGDQRGVLTVDHFIHTFRQFGCHWEAGDVPPSGPQDTAWVTRDLMAGAGSAAYCQHVRRVFPGLLRSERAQLSTAMSREPLPQLLLQAAGLTPEDLAAMPDAELAVTARNHPELLACHYHLRASARLSATHLAISKHFLFAAVRADGGDGDAPVPNDAGITGLAEQVLEQLHGARQHHVLSPFGRIPRRALQTLSPVRPDPQISTRQAGELLGQRHPASDDEFGSPFKSRAAFGSPTERVVA